MFSSLNACLKIAFMCRQPHQSVQSHYTYLSTFFRHFCVLKGFLVPVHMHQRVCRIQIGFCRHQTDRIVTQHAVFVCKTNCILQVLQTTLYVFLGVLQEGKAVIDFKHMDVIRLLYLIRNELYASVQYLASITELARLNQI